MPPSTVIKKKIKHPVTGKTLARVYVAGKGWFTWNTAFKVYNAVGNYGQLYEADRRMIVFEIVCTCGVDDGVHEWTCAIKVSERAKARRPRVFKVVGTIRLGYGSDTRHPMPRTERDIPNGTLITLESEARDGTVWFYDENKLRAKIECGSIENLMKQDRHTGHVVEVEKS